MFVFICNECGYGKATTSGVPIECPICKNLFDFRRGTHEEYHKCETNDGKIKEEMTVQKPNIQCPDCLGMLYVPLIPNSTQRDSGMICRDCGTYFPEKAIRKRCGS